MKAVNNGKDPHCDNRVNPEKLLLVVSSHEPLVLLLATRPVSILVQSQPECLDATCCRYEPEPRGDTRDGTRGLI